MSLPSALDSAEFLRDQALRIWQAGVHSVRGDLCTARQVRVTDTILRIGSIDVPRREYSRLLVLGAGKASASMAEGLERALGDKILNAMSARGWLNVPEGGLGESTYFHRHPARPAGCNEPTTAAMEGTQAMIDLSQRATQDDLCLFLLSGGASALLVAPRAGITLQDKQQLSRILPAAGANIAELNSVRTCLSQVKGGGLARICQAGRLLTLILSDVLGDPLQVIGSAPTVSVDPSATEALEILVRYGVTDQLPNVVAWLRRAANQQRRSKSTPSVESSSTGIEHCVVVGNLSMAMNAAADLARDLGYQTMILPIDTSSPTAEQEGDHLAERLAELAQLETPQCIISGGEPVVRLAPECRRGTGGRNQQLVLSAGCWLQRHAAHLADRRKKRNWIIFSAGTDGEDGPTDAAGARYDATVADRQGQKNLDATDFLQRNDAYPFFDQVDGLVRTGPTGTNVGDLRVALWHP